MRLLVLGGTRFVGRAVVQDALARGWEVTALNRGVTGTVPDGVTPLTVDRTDPQALADALQGREFDLVVDTWSGAPNVVRTAAQLVTTRRYCYVSSISVYVDGRPPGGDETWPVHDAAATADSTEYGADKRGGELAALESFPDAVLARCGLILGPWENVGRLPWWLDRASRGGRMVAPGRPGQPVQWIDVRDLAAWVNDALTSDVSGPVDLTSPPGHTTWGEVLEAVLDVTGRRAELVWRDQDTVLAAGAEPWTQLPIWVPEGGEWTGFMDGGTAAAVRTGLRSRSIAETARDTWAWIGTDGMPTPPAHRPQPGLPEKLETALLA
jgi:nucleoside-diphosphate-sugar epimerase